MTEPVKVSMSPAIFKTSTGTYAIAGTWIPIPDGTTLETLSRYVVFSPRSTGPQVQFQLPKAAARKADVTVLGQVGGYDIVKKRGATCCTCPGFVFRKNCRHIREWNSVG
jgi:hypothetical protein